MYLLYVYILIIYIYKYMQYEGVRNVKYIANAEIW